MAALVSTIATSISSSLTGILMSGRITNKGSKNATTRGFDIGTSAGVYTISDTTDGSYDVGFFYVTATDLLADTNYYFRAKAYNSTDGWYYGSESYFYTGNTGDYINNTGQELIMPLGITCNDCRISSCFGMIQFNTNTMLYVNMLYRGIYSVSNNIISMGVNEIGTIQPQFLDRGRHKLDFLPISSGYKQST